MPNYMLAPQLAMPAKLHTLTDAAERARLAHRRFAYGRTHGADLVTKHGAPPWEPYDGEPVTSGARTVQRLAEAAGFEVRLIERRDGCTVSGWHAGKRLGFRAHWHRGATDGCSWHAATAYAMIEDARPVEVAAITKTAKAGKRAAGMDRRHLILTATPHGMPIGVTELNARLKALAE